MEQMKNTARRPLPPAPAAILLRARQKSITRERADE